MKQPAQMLQPLQVGSRVQRLDLDALGRVPAEIVGLLAACLLLDQRLGQAVTFDFTQSGGGWVSAKYSAFGLFSVELNSACRDR